MDELHHMESVENAVNWFADEMKGVLLEEKNLKKTHWLECSEEWLVGELLTRLGRAITPENFTSNQSSEDKVKLLTDVANFSMMLADKEYQRLNC